MRFTKETELNAQISILATYKDRVIIRVYDMDSGVDFLEVEMTHEQFVNAAMNRLSNCETIRTTVCDLDKLGRVLEVAKFEFELPGADQLDSDEKVRSLAREFVKAHSGSGWEIDTSFNNQGWRSCKNYNDPAVWIRTTMRRWNKKKETG
jgi:hypothetical protein